MRIKIAYIGCSQEGWGTIMDCDPKVCFLCKYHLPGDFVEEEVTPFELRNLIKTNKFVIKDVRF